MESNKILLEMILELKNFLIIRHMMLKDYFFVDKILLEVYKFFL